MSDANEARRARGVTLREFLAGAMRGHFSPAERFFPQYLRSFLACLLPWSLIEGFAFAQDLSFRLYWDRPLELQDSWMWLLRIVLSAALTPFILWIGARWPIERQMWSRRLAMHIGVAICFALVRLGLELGTLYPLNKYGYIASQAWLEDIDTAVVNILIFGFHSAFVRYWVFMSFQAAFRYYDKFREREREAARLELHASELRGQVAHARLGALKMQLQPHFLFNTLNAIVVLVRQQRGRQAEETLTRFSDLLRAVLDDMDAQEVPLHRELEYLRLYLSIEQTRFPDRLQVSIVAAPNVLDAAVPHMGLQPIVENAVRHGIARRAAGGTIHVEASRVGDSVQIIVCNDGPGLAARDDGCGRGMGLANLRARLQQLYGEPAQLQLENGREGGVRATVVLPYSPHPEAASAALEVGELQEDEGEICERAVERVDSR